MDTAATNDSLNDLDGLLDESLQIAEIRKSAKTGTKLTKEQEFLVQARGLAQELEVWVNVRTYAHSCNFSCACGNHFKEFRGWYAYQTKGPYGRRLIRSDLNLTAPKDFYSYNTEATVEFCSKCVDLLGLPGATEAPVCDLLETLCHPLGRRMGDV